MTNLQLLDRYEEVIERAQLYQICEVCDCICDADFELCPQCDAYRFIRHPYHIVKEVRKRIRELPNYVQPI